MNKQIKKQIKNLLINVVERKLKNYKPESDSMPFHFRLIGKDKYVLFSFIQSLNTSFGISIWEPIAEILANSKGYCVKRQVDVVNGKLKGCKEKTKAERFIYKNMLDFINEYIEELLSGKRNPDKKFEINSLKKHAYGQKIEVSKDCADLYVKVENVEYFIDITTAKPNLKEFKALKRKILIWQAIRIVGNTNRIPIGMIGIPYNPYHSKPYERWTLKDLYDLRNGEILVAEEFWNFIAGEDVFNELLNIFENAGKIIKPKIDEFLSKFKDTT